MSKFEELVFDSYGEAKEKVNEMKKMFGYKPCIFSTKKRSSKKIKYIVIKPTSLRRIDICD